MQATRRAAGLFLAASGLLAYAGCGGETPTNPAADTSSAAPGTARVATAEPAAITPEAAAEAEPVEGSPEWRIREIDKLRQQPFSDEIKADVKLLRTAHQERNEDIVDRATQVISAVHEDGEKEHVFNYAVHLLMEARLQLALQGSNEHIDALYEDAGLLYKRDPKSAAAAEAAFTLAQFAHTNAQRYGEKEPDWIKEFAKQARLFAGNFPEQEVSAMTLLFPAARSCELHGMTEEAIACYSVIEAKFPNSPQAKQVPGILKRLQIEGKPVDLSGPTVDGGSFSLEEHRGKVVLVVFWNTESAKFVEQLPAIFEAIAKFKPEQLQVVGVSLDENESAMDAFLEAHADLTWPQIFYPKAEQRGSNHPLVKDFGIRDVPAFWLIDSDGNVATTQAAPGMLAERIEALLGPSTANR